MIKKILIANRGEIAARIIKTCKEMKIKSVAIYSEADKAAPYVNLADEAYLIGAAQVNESYLNMDKIFEVARAAEVDAIHPGYGFMSENSRFAKRCIAEGIIFIGPSANVIEQMGDKIIARKMMLEAGIPVIPGTDEEIQDKHAAVELAREIGYPVMLKAAAGGGGIGMQIVYDDTELLAAFDSNKQRAESFFGNGAMFIEKLLIDVRHIEVQLLHDSHGNGIHLYDRECSIQRRNQKVIEEAPSSSITHETREKMGQLSVEAALKLGYTNAGTIEFLVDKDENFYFLEMNTRIQVEHAITEEITGIDIVREQILIANGDKLSFTQSEININGYAIEARIYAEDPVTFFPSPGKIINYIEPNGKNIRIESSVTEGTQVTPFYDPMISKVIVSGESRKQVITRLNEVLNNYTITGIKTNIPMVLNVINHNSFLNGQTYTNFVEKKMKKE